MGWNEKDGVGKKGVVEREVDSGIFYKDDPRRVVAVYPYIPFYARTMNLVIPSPTSKTMANESYERWLEDRVLPNFWTQAPAMTTRKG